MHAAHNAQVQTMMPKYEWMHELKHTIIDGDFFEVFGAVL